MNGQFGITAGDVFQLHKNLTTVFQCVQSGCLELGMHRRFLLETMLTFLEEPAYQKSLNHRKIKISKISEKKSNFKEALTELSWLSQLLN